MRATYLRRVLAGALLVSGSIALVGSTPSLGAQQTSGSTWNSLPTLAQLGGELALSFKQTSLPTSLVPKLGAMEFGPSKSELYGQTGCGNVAGDGTDIKNEVPCTFGDRTASRSVLVVGDSQAGMWIPTFDSWGVKEHWKIYRLMKFACSPWTDPTTWPNCLAWRRFVIKEILTLKPTVVVASGMEITKQNSAVVVSAKKIESYVLGFETAIAKAHAEVFVMQNIPWYFAQGNPEDCLAANPSDVTKCNHDSPTSVIASSMASGISLAAGTGKVKVIAVDQLFCASKACPVLVGTYNVYMDEFHFQEPWGRYIARAFSQVFTP